MKKPIRIFLVPVWIVALAAFLGLFIEFFEAFIIQRFEVPPDHPAQLRELAGRALMIAMLVYGGYRIVRFHPLFNTRYRAWLELSPWNIARPLPLGPVHLAWQDALLLAIATLVGTLRWQVHPLAPAICLLAGYCLAACIPLTKSASSKTLITAVQVGLASMLLLIAFPLACLGIAMLLSVLVHLGIRDGLNRFPWPPPRQAKIDVGPPFSRLGPVEERIYLRRGNGLHIGLLIGWWLFAVCQMIGDMKASDAAVMVGVFGMIAGLLRLVIYTAHYHSPLSIFGRLFTGRLIIPRFDVVLIAPIAVGIVGIAMPFVCKAMNLQPTVSLGIGIAAIVTAMLELGPSLSDWRLTGAHAMPPFRGPPQRASASKSALDRDILSFFS